RSASAYGGLQETPRTVLIPLTSLVPSTEYHYRLAAKNQTGVFFGADAVLRTSR
ncbi:MAG: hypothetical protein HUU20_24455, partial [Pirellulales bacterium]|nr:hypothetical protein [Pirellulales bacterium]